ncbi:hypothetical protein [Parasynechococcus sp.]|uniref:hypothetical protein n=1 Tax=Parasynechococcus sp. TaxID=3101203 RepID=UPI00370480D9
MPWWSTLICLLLAAQLWASSLRNLDDVIGLLEKILATTLALVVLVVGHNIMLELVGLLVALGLPMARRRT